MLAITKRKQIQMSYRVHSVENAYDLLKLKDESPDLNAMLEIAIQLEGRMLLIEEYDGRTVDETGYDWILINCRPVYYSVHEDPRCIAPLWEGTQLGDVHVKKVKK